MGLGEFPRRGKKGGKKNEKGERERIEEKVWVGNEYEVPKVRAV